MGRVIERIGGLLTGGCRPPARGAPVPGALIAGLSVFLFLWFFLGTILIRETNWNRLASDQQYNIELAREMDGDWFPHRTRGIVNPLWPWLAARIDSAESDAATFARGRWANLIGCAVFLVGAAVVLGRRWGVLPALVFCYAGGFGALLSRAVFFQPEPLFYLLSFVAWALMLSTFWRNPWWTFPVIGGVTGLAYLAKASALPQLGVFLAVGAALCLAAWAPGCRRALLGALDRWSWRRQALGGLIVLVVFTAVIAPLAVFSERQFGSPLHSWPSYWMWQDDFGSESIPFMAAHPDAEALAAVAPDELPSMRNYLATHDIADIRDRLLGGMAARMHEFFFHEGSLRDRDGGKPWKSVLRYRGCLPALFAGLLAALAVVGARLGHFRGRWGAVAACVVFAGGLFVLSWMAFGWYHRIGRGPRFMLGLYLPVLYSLLAGCLWIHRRLPDGHPARWLTPAATAGSLAWILLRMGELMLHPRFED